ncbi:hypothetical protein IDH50_05815 [Aeromicrobium tamlense]|uniref:DUF2238 domain-containing protein n=1 Tax=Aeromicrobium tamlense TaxID=375541 RepID=A0A8I0KGJ6_9ACTN|nr:MULTISPECIES: hypothetical protein [Aeromicrobium]MBD1269736.1 hypothetical protein [Aeromicrobium tamlense]NYI39608.1 hypothetical protein [Aeromicrobium tamlense]
MPLIAPDALRAAGVVSVVAATIEGGWMGFALFFLVLGGLFIPRAIGTGPALDVAYCGTLLLGGWAAQLDWYLAVPELDIVVHAAATGLIAALTWQVLVKVGALPAHDDPRIARPRLGAFIVTITTAVALAVVWEFLEWMGHTWLDDRIQVGYDDTVGDLAAGAIGAVVAALVVSRTSAAEPR